MIVINFPHVGFNMTDTEPSCIVKFQQALKDEGYDPGPIDGWYYNQTRNACQQFQLDQGWTGEDADGLPGPVTFDLLGFIDGDGHSTYTPPPYPGPYNLNSPTPSARTC
jgi:peptidoglycan hydrolase-like protein with peptidoglycan-binding domain